MIRVIYNWYVEPENLKLFIETWKVTTNRIHKTIPGARGSFMLKNSKNYEDIKTIACWNAIEDWRAFWGTKNPEQMQSMYQLGKLISVDLYEEIDDYTQ